MIIERDLYKQIKPRLNSKQAIVITGMRRTGKTTLLRFIFEKIKSKNKLMIELENPLSRKLFEADDYEEIVKSLNNSFALDFSKRVYLFLDEIQFVKNLPSVVKYLIDHYQVKFFLTGSASFYLKNLFSESLAGRKFLYELFPFNFYEFLKLKSSKLALSNKKDLTDYMIDLLIPLYQEYIDFGGFPEVILEKTKKGKKQVLENIFSSYFQMEVKQLGDFKKDRALRDLLILLTQRVGSRLDIQRISQALGIDRRTVIEYLNFLESTYFISLLKPFSRSSGVAVRKNPKVYFCDSGMVNVLTKVDRGTLFEQAVFQTLRQKGNLNYYQKKIGPEIDFILNKKQTFEVKTTALQSDINKLRKIARELKITDYKVITLQKTELKQTLYGFQV
ncbi:hypothetical protein COT20_02295 [bacterium (Candidatus Gribaldobacteria) CG08_land_8_20_14_0_20_39_15]|uniref:ATPase n=1 Tax=bacterium (Candidatus Gribaldobacteria) CG08_land_8_20_14_0_20_39_15 TaxID=2014273 RepID=A0A2M6XU60_9BACT|nr:MAG: hypothetical protein COT20_02295 [bacterium (Candidatus Gribaldobacteria) CG08_land_8_20_14_0_20_39_15]